MGYDAEAGAMEALERFYEDLDQANADLQHHVKIGILAWGGDPSSPDLEWRGRYMALRERRNAAEEAVLELISPPGESASAALPALLR